MRTVAECQELWLKGAFCALGEYRSSKAEMISWRDKASGRPMSAPMLRHTVEFGEQSVAVSERVPDNTKLEDIKVPFIKGERVFLVVSEYTTTKGLVACRGTLDKVSPSPADGSSRVGGKSGG